MGLMQWQLKPVFVCILLASITIIGCASNNGTVKGGGTIIGNPTPMPFVPEEPLGEEEDRFYAIWTPGHILLLLDIPLFQHPMIIGNYYEKNLDITDNSWKNRNKIKIRISPIKILNRQVPVDR